MPPFRAMAMAMVASVTVSMAADTMGMCNSRPSARRVAVLASLGSTSDRRGTSSTSSKVNACGPNFSSNGGRSGTSGAIIITCTGSGRPQDYPSHHDPVKPTAGPKARRRV